MSDQRAEGISTRTAVIGTGIVLCIFLVIYTLSLAVLNSFIASGVEPATDPQDLRVSMAVIAGVIGVSGVVLLLFHFGYNWIFRAVILLVAVLMTLMVADAILPSYVEILGLNLVSVGVSIAVCLPLAIRPRWHTINIAAIFLGAGAVAFLGLSLGILTAIVLLIVLALYDAISVYGTKHMLTLADGVIESRLPIVLIIPTQLDRSSSSSGTFDQENIIVIGLGDAIIPGILVGSAVAHDSGTELLIAGMSVTLPAIGTMLGIGVGVCLLFGLLTRGGAHAGLPLLNTGAIMGYLASRTADSVEFLDVIKIVAATLV